MKLAIAATVMISTVMTAHSASAETVPTEDTITAANDAGLDPADVQGALNTLRPSHPELDAQTYVASLAMALSDAPAQGVSEDGGRAFPAAPVLALTGRLACIAWRESHNDPNATNRRSGAGGLFQFLLSTWMTTPQGRAGLSRYDPIAATEAAKWMVAQGRITEWQVVALGYC